MKTTKGYFGPTSTMPHLTPLNQPSFASLPRDLRNDATCTIRRRSSTRFEAKLGNSSPTCITMKQAAGCRCVSALRLHPVIGFEAQTDKPPPTLFWGPNQETVVVGLRQKHWQTIATGFEAKPGNPRFSSPPCVWCGSHTALPDLLIVQPPSTQLVPDHPWSFAPSLLLLPWS
jgi:hypothetical protein